MRQCNFRSIEEFRAWAGDPANYESAEYQANEFAGRLLVPRDILLKCYDDYRQKAEGADPTWREIEGMREHLAKKIAPRFGVNHQVIETRFDRERIWPVE
jgi:Zn-dependent peptidase ImmA (M78 family)